MRGYISKKGRCDDGRPHAVAKANDPRVTDLVQSAGRLAYINEFVEEAKASGLVQRTIQRAGLRGVQVAPLASPMK
jgi:hypothetical protein